MGAWVGSLLMLGSFPVMLLAVKCGLNSDYVQAGCFAVSAFALGLLGIGEFPVVYGGASDEEESP